MAGGTKDSEFLEYVVKAIVNHPEDVKIKRTVDEMGVLLSLKVHPDDMGQVIGKQGSVVRSLRNLVRIVGLRNHARVNLRVEEPERKKKKKALKIWKKSFEYSFLETIAGKKNRAILK